MLPNCLQRRLRNAVYIRILAGFLILTGASCWDVKPPSPEQTDASRAVAASTPQLASAELSDSPAHAASPTSTPPATVPSHRTAKTARALKRHRSRPHHARTVVASSRSPRKENTKLATTAVRTTSNVPDDLPPTSIIAAP